MDFPFAKEKPDHPALHPLALFPLKAPPSYQLTLKI